MNHDRDTKRAIDALADATRVAIDARLSVHFVTATKPAAESVGRFDDEFEAAIDAAQDEFLRDLRRLIEQGNSLDSRPAPR